MAKLTKTDREKIIENIKQAKGKVTLAARMSGVSRQTLYVWAKEYATIQNAIDEARNEFDESLLDAAEAKLREAVLNGERWAIIYALNKKGHERGYRDEKRHEHTGPDGDALTIRIEYPDDDGNA